MDPAKSLPRAERRPLPPDDPKRRCPDISLARKTLGWEPHIFEDGLEATINCFRYELNCRCGKPSFLDSLDRRPVRPYEVHVSLMGKVGKSFFSAPAPADHLMPTAG